MNAHVVNEHCTAFGRSAACRVGKELNLDCLAAILSQADSRFRECARIRGNISAWVVCAFIRKRTAVGRNLHNQVIAGRSHVRMIECQFIRVTVIRDCNSRCVHKCCASVQRRVAHSQHGVAAAAVCTPDISCTPGRSGGRSGVVPAIGNDMIAQPLKIHVPRCRSIHADSAAECSERHVVTPLAHAATAAVCFYANIV